MRTGTSRWPRSDRQELGSILGIVRKTYRACAARLSSSAKDPSTINQVQASGSAGISVFLTGA